MKPAFGTLRGHLRVFPILAALLSAPLAANDDGFRWNGIARVVAFGDVHGAYRELVPLLQQARVIDAQLHWSGGATHLISLGDILDRGPDSRAVMDLLMRLETEAPKSGGFVHVVLGNHEVMNLTGDLRYVSAAEYTAFAPAAPAASSIAATLAPADGATAPPPLPGEVEHRQAFSAEGVYGKWLLAKPALIVVNDTVFVHGGLPQSVGALGLADANVRLHDELIQAMVPGSAAGALLSQTGPLWYRGTARCHVLLDGDRLRRTLTQLSARRVAIGHTPTEIRRAQSRFSGDVVMLDTGMLVEVYHGRATALVIENGNDRVVVAGDTSVPTVLPEIGGYAGEWTASDRHAARLAEAPVVRSSDVVGGVKGERDVTLADDLAARFVPLTGDRARHEVAAYRVDRLLQLGIVPPAVEREIDRSRGVLTVSGGGWTPERARSAAATARANDCESGTDYLLMLAFDALIGNATRSVDTLGYDRRSGDLVLRDNGNAFSTAALKRDPKAELPRLPPALRARLAALNERALADAAGTTLTKREIAALLQRRDVIVNTWPILE